MKLKFRVVEVVNGNGHAKFEVHTRKWYGWRRWHFVGAWGEQRTVLYDTDVLARQAVQDHVDKLRATRFRRVKVVAHLSFDV